MFSVLRFLLSVSDTISRTRADLHPPRRFHLSLSFNSSNHTFLSFLILIYDASPILRMENKQTGSGTQDNSIMKSVDQRARSKGRSDILTRRLKNRERQRRYRARKRLEAETKKPFIVEETAAVQVELQPNGNHNFMTRIYCKRDWKKDARRAHVSKHQEMNGSIDPSPTLTCVPEVTCLALGNKAETMLEREIQSGPSNNEIPRIVLGRRDWKAEARRKKN